MPHCQHPEKEFCVYMFHFRTFIHLLLASAYWLGNNKSPLLSTEGIVSEKKKYGAFSNVCEWLSGVEKKLGQMPKLFSSILLSNLTQHKQTKYSNSILNTAIPSEERALLRQHVTQAINFQTRYDNYLTSHTGMGAMSRRWNVKRMTNIAKVLLYFYFSRVIKISVRM